MTDTVCVVSSSAAAGQSVGRSVTLSSVPSVFLSFSPSLTPRNEETAQGQILIWPPPSLLLLLPRRSRRRLSVLIGRCHRHRVEITDCRRRRRRRHSQWKVADVECPGGQPRVDRATDRPPLLERTAFCGDGRKFGSSFTRELSGRHLPRMIDRQATDRLNAPGKFQKRPPPSGLPALPPFPPEVHRVRLI